MTRFLVAFVALHLAFTEWSQGLRIEHWVANAFLLIAWFAHAWTRRLAVVVFPFMLAGVLYDNLRFASPYRGEIHVDDIYFLERSWFGIDAPGGQVVPPMWWQDHTHWLLDLVCGAAYIAYLPGTILVCVMLFATRDDLRAKRMAWGFFLLNVIGVTTQVLFPVAPPWYVSDYGLGPADTTALPSAAGAARFDALVGTTFFAEFYSRNPNVFGAMPSLHVAYPFLATFSVIDKGWRWVLPPFILGVVVAFSAIYLNHHYIVDAMAGIAASAVATLVSWVVATLLARTQR